MVKIIEDETCHMCIQKETIDHMLWECIAVGSFWNSVETLLKKKVDDNIQINKKEVFLGLEGHPKESVINHVLLCAKHYLYKNRSLKRKPALNSFERYLSKTILNEKSYYTYINKIHVFNVKWCDLLYLCNLYS